MSRVPEPVAVPLAKAYRLLNHGPTVLVTTAAGERRDVMAAAWVMPVDFDPPKVAIVVDRETLTRELMTESGRFGLTVPPVAAIDLTEAVGSVSGRAVDKFAAFAIETFAAETIAAPHLSAGVAWLECEIIPEPGIATAHDLFVARVLAAKADPRAFADGHWVDGDPSLRTIHHVAGGNFFTAGALISAHKP